MSQWLSTLKSRKMWQISNYHTSIPLWDNYFIFPGRLLISLLPFSFSVPNPDVSWVASSILKLLWNSVEAAFGRQCTLQATCWLQMTTLYRKGCRVICGATEVSVTYPWWRSLIRHQDTWPEYNIILICASDEVGKHFCFTFLPSSLFLCPFPLIVTPQSLLTILLSIIKIFIVKCKHWS